MRRTRWLLGALPSLATAAWACSESSGDDEHALPEPALDAAPSRSGDARVDVIPLPSRPNAADSPCELAGYRCYYPETHPKGIWPACGLDEHSQDRPVLPYSCKDSDGRDEALVCCNKNATAPPVDAGMDVSDSG